VKVFTFFYNRYETATTSVALNQNGIDHYALIHNDSDLQKFKKGNTLAGRPLVTGNGKGLAYQRNSALEMMNRGEWAVFMCDDFQKIKSFSREFIFSKTNKINITTQNQNAFRLKKEISIKEMFSFFPKLIQLAEANNIHLIGFGLHDNPMNLGRKFTHKGLADGRFWLVKKSSYKFDLNAQLIDDVNWKAENLVRHGNVLVLNWLVPYFSRYTAGGFGSTEQRKALRKKECAYLANKFDPLVRVASKPGWDEGTHIKLFASKGNIDLAKKRMGII
jgi:hypothetical protein